LIVHRQQRCKYITEAKDENYSQKDSQLRLICNFTFAKRD